MDTSFLTPFGLSFLVFLMNIPTKFGSNWPGGFREDSNVKVYWRRRRTHNDDLWAWWAKYFLTFSQSENLENTKVLYFRQHLSAQNFLKATSVIVRHEKKCLFLWRTKSHNSATSKVNIEKIERDQTSINPNTVSNFMKFGQGKFELSLEVWTDWFTIIHFRSKLGRNVHWMIF